MPSLRGEFSAHGADVSDLLGSVMSKPFTTVKLLHGKEPFLRQMVCEVRFQDGYLYLDHTGRLLKKLARDSAEWIVAPDPTPKGTAVFNTLDVTVLQFGLRSANFMLDRSAYDDVIAPEEAEKYIK